ncbi:MAG: hypothetical protein F6K11_34545, partial [Leptolyngbya sp. SIO3F4]|nr:hypothetical protein [Leptolyngbya sp. SIO3F4]
WAFQVSSSEKTASSENKPPAVEFYDGGTNAAEVHYEGEAYFTPRGGTSGRNRERLYTLEFGFSNLQMVTMSALHRGLLIGRHLGDEIELEINDALLTTPPLPEIHAVDGPDTYKYLGDALSMEFTNTQATAHCVGIWMDGGYLGTAAVIETTAAGQDSITLELSAFGLSETAPAATDSITLVEAGAFSLTETGTAGTDAISLTETTALSGPSETAAPGTENLALTEVVALTLTETGPTTTDTISLTEVTDLSVQETGAAGTDAFTLTDLGGSTDADSNAWIAALSGTYSAAELSAFDAFYSGLKTDSLYTKVKFMWTWALDSSSDALVEMVSASTVGSQTNMTFTAREGFTGNNSNSFINSSVIPDNVVGLDRDDTAIHFYIRSKTDNNTNSDYGGRSGIGQNLHSVRINSTGNDPLTTLNNSSSPVGVAVDTGITGMFTASRVSSSATDLYKNGSLVGSLSQTSTGQPTTAMYFAAFNNGGTVASSSDGQYAFGAITEGMDATEAANFNTRVTALLTALGANV